MTIINSQPDNTNILQPTKFLVVFPRILGTQYFCQTVNIPGVSIDAFEQSTRFAILPVPGNRLSFDEFTMTFLVDAELLSWKQIQQWIHALGMPTSHEDYQQLSKQIPWMSQTPLPQYSDGTLSVLSGLNNPKYRVQFKDMFPIRVSGIDFSTMESADNIITATATFRYAYYTIEKI